LIIFFLFVDKTQTFNESSEFFFFGYKAKKGKKKNKKRKKKDLTP